MVRLRLLSFLLTLSFVALAGFAFSLLARGYRLDLKNFGFRPTGLLVVTSVPDGAQILINRELESATNATISLPPDTYDIEIKKEGFLAWKKRLTITKEEVTKADVVIFPIAPSLSALTFAGATRPILSPDGTKIAYGVEPAENSPTESKVGLWIMDLGDLPIGFSRDPRQISDANPTGTTWRWSPDSRQILLSSKTGVFLLNSGSMTPQNKLVNIEGSELKKVIVQWEEEENKRIKPKLSRLPDQVRDILERKTEYLAFSPDENKVLYTASASAQISDNLKAPLPGSSTQKQDRDIKIGKTYVYDIKEDRNFFIEEGLKLENSSLASPAGGRRLVWFPTSNHLILGEVGKVTIMDYDGTNRQIVWGGPYEAPYAIPFPNITRLLILTSLGGGFGSAANLYSLSLK